MKKKIKVLQFPILNARGGITQYAINNWKFINQDIFQFDFATLSKKLDFENELTRDGCKVHYLSCSAEMNKKQFMEEMDGILENHYDVIHLHTSYWKSFLVEKLAKKHKIPKIIVHAHSTMIDIDDECKRGEALKRHEEIKKLFDTSLATHFCACSRKAAEWLFGEQIPKEKICILENAIDIEKFSYKPEIREIYRKKLGVSNCFVIGNVARFVYPKNHAFLIDVFKKISEKILEARLLLVGDGKLLEEMKRKCRDYKIEDKVIFLGKRDDVSELMQAMDVFCLPSRFEGLPIVLIEAQCNGLRCFVSDSISDEVKITDRVVLSKLDVQIWNENIVGLFEGFYREGTNLLQVKKMGFSIHEQIRKIEKLYNS